MSRSGRTVGLTTDHVGIPQAESRNRTTVLALCCTGLFVVGLDNTIVNLAMPSIGFDLRASLPSLQWIIDAYTVVLASLLLLAGSIGDRIGRKRIFQIGLILFGIGSLLCSVAPGVGTLIGFRVLQGVGGCMLNPASVSIIATVFTESRERAKAIGIWGSVAGVSWALGPILGGALVQTIGWRSVFWVNVPVILIAALLVRRHVPESRSPSPRSLDPLGQLLVILMLATLTYAIIEAPTLGIGSPWIIACGLASATSVVAFVAYERRIESPLLDIRFFSSAPFSGGVLIAVCGYATVAGFLFLNTLYLQVAREFSPLHAGLLILPAAIMIAVTGPVSGRISATNPRLPLAAGALGMAVSSLSLRGLDAHSTTAELSIVYAGFGFGFGLLNPAITNAAVSGMPASRAGVAAAVASAGRQVGATLGVAVLGSVVTARNAGPMHTDFIAVAQPAWLIMVGASLFVLLIGVVTTSHRALRTVQTFDEELGTS